jgi:uncharacterized protein YjbI with pentapeptide repeats
MELNIRDNPKYCNEPGCNNLALTLADHCFEHFPDKREYLIRLKKWSEEQNGNLERFILIGIDLAEYPEFRDIFQTANLKETALVNANLEEANLRGVNFEQAYLTSANLRRAKLWDANFRRAALTNADLTQAFIINADLREANLAKAILEKAAVSFSNLKEADFLYADLKEAHFYNSNLSGASFVLADLTGAKFYGDTSLAEADLSQAKLTDVKGLTEESFTRGRGTLGGYVIGKKERQEPRRYKETYLNIKKYFLEAGRYNEASWSAYREKVLERINILPECFVNYSQLRLRGERGLPLVAAFVTGLLRTAVFLPRVILSLIVSAISGYGEKPERVIISAIAIIFLFSLFFFKSGLVISAPDGGIVTSFGDNLYFSTITFTTIGYGDLHPQDIPAARTAASIEGLIGVFMIALFVWTIARRYSGR